MNVVYNFLGLAFLMILFWGYGRFSVLAALILTVISFGVSVVGFVRSESRVN